MHCVNIGGLIEADTAAAENWRVNHSVPASVARATRLAQLSTDSLCYSCFYAPPPFVEILTTINVVLSNLPFLCFAALLFVVLMTVLLNRNRFSALGAFLFPSKPIFLYNATLWTRNA